VSKLVIFIVFVSFILSCSSSDKSSNVKVLIHHYIAQIQKLKNDNVKLTKYISKGEKQDTLYIDTVNWKRELSLFLESDISKKKISLYKITSFEDSSKFLFQTNSYKQDVKKLKYSLSNNDLIVNIDVHKRSGLYDFFYYLELSSKGYLIKVKQKVNMVYESKYTIEGKFRK